jgi:hypothetical protein
MANSTIGRLTRLFHTGAEAPMSPATTVGMRKRRDPRADGGTTLSMMTTQYTSLSARPRLRLRSIAMREAAMRTAADTGIAGTNAGTPANLSPTSSERPANMRLMKATPPPMITMMASQDRRSPSEARTAGRKAGTRESRTAFTGGNPADE